MDGNNPFLLYSIQARYKIKWSKVECFTTGGLIIRNDPLDLV